MLPYKNAELMKTNSSRQISKVTDFRWLDFIIHVFSPPNYVYM